MTDRELPEGVRLVLIHALELCGSVLAGDPIEVVRERAELMFVVCSEHIEVEEGEDE